MKILIAEDDPSICEVLETLFRLSGYQVVTATNGAQAWAVLQEENAPRLAILDVMMPHIDGIELCRMIRREPRLESTYVILLTARRLREDLLEGLNAGADDYIFKPPDVEELQARVRIGERIVRLQTTCANHAKNLEETLAQVKQLQGILPLCAYCKKIRDDQNYWQRVENYISEHSEAQITHSICPDCYASIVQPQLDKLKD